MSDVKALLDKKAVYRKDYRAMRLTA